MAQPRKQGKEEGGSGCGGGLLEETTLIVLGAGVGENEELLQNSWSKE